MKKKELRKDAEYRAKEAKEKKEFEARVQEVELELSDAEEWKKAREVNSDGYGGAALDYAEGWAKLMQIEIAKGKLLPNVMTIHKKDLDF